MFFFKLTLFVFLQNFSVPGPSCSMPDLCWGMNDLVLWPGLEPEPPALGAWSLNHWKTREVLPLILIGLTHIQRWLWKACAPEGRNLGGHFRSLPTSVGGYEHCCQRRPELELLNFFSLWRSSSWAIINVPFYVRHLLNCSGQVGSSAYLHLTSQLLPCRSKT